MLVLKLYSPVHERTAKKKDGTEFRIRYQEAEIIQEGRRPRVIELSTPGQGHYSEGLYTLSVESFRPDRYERLELAFPNLIPLDKALKTGEKELKTWKHRNVA